MKFKTEAELCAAFIAWVTRERPEVRCYPEWAGWDILLAYPEGFQIGVQAKLRVNAKVILQAVPNEYGDGRVPAPDYRAVLVPERNGLADVAKMLGLVVFYAAARGDIDRAHFLPDLRPWPWRTRGAGIVDREWLDWNPATRHALPPTATDSVAGSSAPVTLTPWKLCALDVLAELEVKRTITTKRMRQLGVDPRRWQACAWLEAEAERGVYVRGEQCPKFDQQHPTAYAAALAKARGAVAA